MIVLEQKNIFFAIKKYFPGIFENHRLHQAWAYKYDSRQTGIRVHADFAAVNVNFWITPDSANLNSSNGGLIVYKEKAPLDWSFNLYNSVNLFLSPDNRCW